MVYWHVETDFIALAIYIVLFIKAALLNHQKDFTDKMFSMSLVLGVVATLIDIFSSVIMNERMGWWIYEIGMIVYGLSVPILSLFWFLYTISLIYQGNKPRVRMIIIIFGILYALYALVIVTNPIHELYFHLTPDIVYSRGKWFLPLIEGSQTVMGAIGIVMVLTNRKRFQSKPIMALLLLLYVITAGVYYLQIAFPGWLIVDAVYAVAFLICDATFESQRRDNLYKTIQRSVVQLQEEREKTLDYQQKLEETVREANRANQAKSEFLSRMSHDIRTPINGIRGMLGIIRKERSNQARVDDCLGKIETSSGYLLSLINDVLDMSKLESGEIILAQEPFDLRKVTADCESVLSQTATGNGVDLVSGGGAQKFPHPYLIGSPLHLRQVLLNIAGNAVKYNRPGGNVTCSVEEAGFDGEQVLCRFVIRDNGIGISPEFLPHLFQPFAQEHTGARTRYEGTGLGLAIVKKIIDQMGGDISVESEVGVGSTFTFTLPFAVDHHPPLSSLARQEEPDAQNLSGVRLLVVEDNELNLEIAQYILEDAGAEVIPARNGQEAVDLFGTSPPGAYQAILMDVMMPVMDGLEAARVIRAMDHPDAKTVPIIAMTANAFSEDVRKCREAGMDAHLAKPLDAGALFKALSENITL